MDYLARMNRRTWYSTFERISTMIRSSLSLTSLRSQSKVIKPHIPQIKFPLRGNKLGKQTTSMVLDKPGNVESLVSQNVSNSAPKKSSASVSKGSTIESSELPLKYKRKLLSQEEMEYIEKGGQV